MVKLDEVFTIIKSRNLYKDFRSKEKFTGKIRDKYKLAGNVIPELEGCHFTILTKRLSSCNRRYTIKIGQEHWEERARGNYLQAEFGYCDVTSCELLTKDYIFNKMVRRSFPYVARLCLPKFLKLQKLRDKAERDKFISKEVRDLILRGIPPSIDKLVKKLGVD